MTSKQVTIGTKTIELPGSILEKLETEKLTIIIFKSSDCVPHIPEVCNRNIIAFDDEGKELWRIEEAKDYFEEWKPFQNIWINENGQLMAGAGFGGDYVVDLKSGKIETWRDPAWPPGYKPRPW